MSLRELLHMADAKIDNDWSHTASLMCLIANCHRDPKKRRKPFTSYDFHPHRERPSGGERMKDLKILKRVFVDR